MLFLKEHRLLTMTATTLPTFVLFHSLLLIQLNKFLLLVWRRAVTSEVLANLRHLLALIALSERIRIQICDQISIFTVQKSTSNYSDDILLCV